MKKLFYTILIFLVSLTVVSQSCLPEGITFTTQSQIDSFQIIYPKCTEIEGDVIIYGWQSPDKITNLDSLSVLINIGSNFSIEHNDSLTNLTGLVNITSIGGDLILDDNDALTSLTGLDALISVGGSLTIDRHNVLSSIANLNSMTSIEGDLEIRWNNVLSSLAGLNNVTSIGENLYIYGNDSLTSMEGLDNVTSIGSLFIDDNCALTSLTGLENVTSIGSHLGIVGNGALTSLEGLEGLTSIEGSFVIYRNGDLSSLEGLEGLTSIGTDLRIGCQTHNGGGNSSLISLTGLGGLTSIGGSLEIFGNDVLTSLEGIDNIDAASIINLSVYYNQELSTCEVQNLCEYLADPNGEVIIEDNASGCNSVEEVEEACTSSISENSTLYGINTHPNPFTTSTTLSYSLNQPATVQLSVFNQLGQLVYQHSEEQTQGSQQLQWDALGLAEGIYFYRLKARDAVANGKLVKVR